jgi:pimeloyl-ACP methyl ester carboxylesterase
MWAEHLRPIAAAGHRVIAPDLPGFGEAPETSPLAPWEDVLATMDAAGVQRAALAGVSFGGAVAERVAVVAPERVTRLAVFSAPPPGLEPSERLRAAWTAENEAIERGDVEAAVAAVVDAWTLPGAPADVRDRIAAAQRRAYELQQDDVEEAPDPLDDDPAALDRLTLPRLVAAGEHDMPDFQRPGAVLIPGAGHLAPLEQPEAFRELLLDFLARD